mmetsp:Transcript_29189/g.66097  ORF Transcript_29189/g.66097 Transcript_29189/m.66097 type:complete len:208 (-) Transcript_29189:485-1108(-)
MARALRGHASQSHVDGHRLCMLLVNGRPRCQLGGHQRLRHLQQEEVWHHLSGQGVLPSGVLDAHPSLGHHCDPGPAPVYCASEEVSQLLCPPLDRQDHLDRLPLPPGVRHGADNQQPLLHAAARHLRDRCAWTPAVPDLRCRLRAQERHVLDCKRHGLSPRAAGADCGARGLDVSAREHVAHHDRDGARHHLPRRPPGGPHMVFPHR